MTFAVFLFGLMLQAPAAPHYRILSECDSSAEVRAEIEKNTAMEIRFAIAGSPVCYSVTATVNGQVVRGYVTDRSLDAVQAFEKARVAVEREAFSKPPAPSAPAAKPESSEKSTDTKAVDAKAADSKADAKKDETKTASTAPVKVEKNVLKQTPKVDF